MQGVDPTLIVTVGLPRGEHIVAIFVKVEMKTDGVVGRTANAVVAFFMKPRILDFIHTWNLELWKDVTQTAVGENLLTRSKCRDNNWRKQIYGSLFVPKSELGYRIGCWQTSVGAKRFSPTVFNWESRTRRKGNGYYYIWLWVNGSRRVYEGIKNVNIEKSETL